MATIAVVAVVKEVAVIISKVGKKLNVVVPFAEGKRTCSYWECCCLAG